MAEDKNLREEQVEEVSGGRPLWYSTDDGPYWYSPDINTEIPEPSIDDYINNGFE